MKKGKGHKSMSHAIFKLSGNVAQAICFCNIIHNFYFYFYFFTTISRHYDWKGYQIRIY
jgi:hypothetical protein